MIREAFGEARHSLPHKQPSLSPDLSPAHPGPTPIPDELPVEREAKGSEGKQKEPALGRSRPGSTSDLRHVARSTGRHSRHPSGRPFTIEQEGPRRASIV